MARCSLCSERIGKRYCPVKGFQICALCCGTKRETEIDCPASCGYLQASRSYEAEKLVPDPHLTAAAHLYDQHFLHRYSPILDAISRSVLEERSNWPWLVDSDVIEVYKSLSDTMKTLSSGIYYESLPEGSVRLSLFRRLKTLMDGMMQLQPNAGHNALKVSECVEVLDFLILSAQVNSSVRPKSRRYLDWLGGMAGIGLQAEQPPSLFLP